jgi:hypothetical protein
MLRPPLSSLVEVARRKNEMAGGSRCTFDWSRRSFYGTVLESLEVASGPVLYSQEDCDRIGEDPDSAPLRLRCEH